MALLREIQEIEYDMLQFLHSQCERLGIHYSMVAGTLLGAVRHQAFIPWDDDIDVYMSIENFKKFEKYFNSDEFFLQTPKTDPEMPRLWYKIRKNGTVMKEEDTMNLNIQQGIWLDIFTYTNAGKNKTTKKLQVFFRNVLRAFRRKYLLRNKGSARWYHLFFCLLPDKLNLTIDRFLLFLIKLMGSQKSDEYFALDTNYLKTWFFKKSFFDNTILYKFEDGEFWGIKEADEYLRGFYGDDYMTPKKWGHIKDYSAVVAGGNRDGY